MTPFSRRPIDVDSLLDRLEADPDISVLGLLLEVVRWVRPAAPGSDQAGSEAEGRIRELCTALKARGTLRGRVSERLRVWLDKAEFFPALTSVGILPRKGFHTELARRLYERINPPPKDPHDLSDMLELVFTHDDDGVWVSSVSDNAWLSLFTTLWQPPDNDWRSPLILALDEIIYALEMLSIWVAAEELEPDLVRLEPRLMSRDSPFIGFQREMSGFVRACEAWLAGETSMDKDDAHARVLLDQCNREILFFRRRAVSRGTSIATTYLLERLEQTLRRIGVLLDIVDVSQGTRSLESACGLFRELVAATSRRNSIRDLWRQNIRLLSRTVTENVSDHGEHYVTRDRKEYAAMFRSAAGAGLIIPLLALIKIKVGTVGFDPALETLLYCLIYGLGFVLVHLLGFTIATKQPAMTAARFAGAVEKEGRGGANPRLLARLLVQVSRSQFIAIVGNVSVALVVALCVGEGYRYLTGQTLLSEAQRNYQHYALQPFAGLALFHAAIAGVWLFLSGLIAGFFDNRAAYLSVAERFRYHPLIRRILPSSWRVRIGHYLAEHSGSIAGNFLFGCMLGATGYAGDLVGLPLDIRHVAFSSANLGYAPVTDPSGFAVLFACVMLIGLANLMVSFSLALFVALRARGVRISSVRLLFRALFQEIRMKPSALVWPPEDESAQGR
ncbi:site-specific recombinase [Desulfatiferula olefinivorans]